MVARPSKRYDKLQMMFSPSKKQRTVYVVHLRSRSLYLSLLTPCPTEPASRIHHGPRHRPQSIPRRYRPATAHPEPRCTFPKRTGRDRAGLRRKHSLEWGRYACLCFEFSHFCFPSSSESVVANLHPGIFSLRDCDYVEWTSVPALETIQQIVCRTSNRVFVGLPLCESFSLACFSV